MTMISMKPQRQESGTERDAACHGGCGLCLCLDEDQVEALGLDRQPPAAGTKVGIRAVAQVRRITRDVDVNDAGQGEDGDGGVTLELHITDLEVTPEARAPASVLYGNNRA